MSSPRIVRDSQPTSSFVWFFRERLNKMYPAFPPRSRVINWAEVEGALFEEYIQRKADEASKMVVEECVRMWHQLTTDVIGETVENHFYFRELLCLRVSVAVRFTPGF
ncbi:hypothetical protein Y032_0045g1170 [Ancylostoma ceylanicum]|uniref:Uncharacterized protein n=1 Tax=Ancylostoma ceylanicum TaxID=53326 RepID=A0A016UC91_9BILA|nr:hypothetical protein Y032_0045g1170 [Ancylostoma ceylanicum]